MATHFRGGLPYSLKEVHLVLRKLQVVHERVPLVLEKVPGMLEEVQMIMTFLGSVF